MFGSRVGSTLFLSVVIICLFSPLCLAQFTSMGETAFLGKSSYSPKPVSHIKDVTADQSNQGYGSLGFTEVGSSLGIPNNRWAATWGDYDNDGTLDLLTVSYYGFWTSIYHNDQSGMFAEVWKGLEGSEKIYGNAAWGDYDNDGDLDFVTSAVGQIYRNDGNGVFTYIRADIGGIDTPSFAWGDYDNDGDLDLAVSGNVLVGNITRVYRNNGNDSFTDISAGLPGYHTPLEWVDYDNDGDLDLSLASRPGIYRNDGNGVFTYVNLGFISEMYSRAWGDYDNDGDMDVIVAGSSRSAAKIYRNDGNGVFVDINVALIAAYGHSVAWGDYDNDGDIDILLAGYGSDNRAFGIVYRNDGGGIFTDINAGLVGSFAYDTAAWGDYDNDGDLDATIGSRVYRNDSCKANTVPTAPTGLSASLRGSDVVLTWNAASDAETPAGGLTYNLRVGTSPGAGNLFSGMANLTTGYRRLPAIGNVQKNLSWTLKAPPVGTTIYWSVQAVDTAFAGSPWATERQCTVRDNVAPVINSVIVTPSLAAANDNLTLTVDAVDNILVNSVTVGGVLLTKTGSNTWTASLVANSLPGSHMVTVVARDADGNSSSGSGSYTTGRVVGLGVRGTADAIMSEASLTFLFTLWGRVTVIDADNFFLDDGSGTPVKVEAAGHGLVTGDYASARGILSKSAGSAVLQSQANRVKKQN